MMIFELPWLSMTEVRYRLSRASSLLHTSQLHATTGTPVEVPVPRKVTFIISFLFDKGKGAEGYLIYDLRFTIYDFGLWISDFGFRISDFGFRIYDFRLTINDFH